MVENDTIYRKKKKKRIVHRLYEWTVRKIIIGIVVWPVLQGYKALVLFTNGENKRRGFKRVSGSTLFSFYTCTKSNTINSTTRNLPLSNSRLPLLFVSVTSSLVVVTLALFLYFSYVPIVFMCMRSLRFFHRIAYCDPRKSLDFCYVGSTFLSSFFYTKSFHILTIFELKLHQLRYKLNESNDVCFIGYSNIDRLVSITVACTSGFCACDLSIYFFIAYRYRTDSLDIRYHWNRKFLRYTRFLKRKNNGCFFLSNNIWRSSN